MKYNNSIKYGIGLILICFLLLGNSGIMSRIFLSSIRNEVIPVACDDNSCKEGFIRGIVPSTGIDNEGYYVVSDNGGQGSLDDVSLTLELEQNSNNQVYSSEISTDSTANNDNGTDDVNDTTTVTNDATSDSSETEIPVINVPGNNLDIGIHYSMEQLNDFEFLISNCYTVDSSTSITPEDVNAESLLSMDMSLDLSGDDYKVLIYHSHGSEAFADSRPGVTEDTIIGVGDELTQILEEDYGIKTYHDRTVYDIVDGKLDRNYAYTNSGYGIDKILQEHPSIEVVLDLHRDGVRDEVRLVKTIDGKPTAQIMFFNGISRLNDEGDLGYLYNPNLSANLGFSLKMHLEGKRMYGDLMRKIYIGGYCYNLDRAPRASLIEVGAQTNTVQEVKNAMTPLAAILYSVLTEK